MVEGINNPLQPNIPGRPQILFGKKNSENIFAAESIFDKGIKISDFTNNSQRIANALNNTQDGANDGVLDQNELNAFWNEVLLAAGDDGKLSDGEANRLLKKFGLDKAGIKKEDLYQFLNDITAQGDKVENSTIEQENGKPVVVINYKKDESGNTVQERHNQDGSLTRTTTTQDGTTTTVILNSEGKKLKETVTLTSSNIEETVYDEDGQEIPQTTTVTNSNNPQYKMIVSYFDGEKASAVETNGQTMVNNYIFTDDGDMLLNSKTVNKGLPTEKTTIYQYNDQNQIVYITEGENEYKCIPNGDVSIRLPIKEVNGRFTTTYEYDDNNNPLTKRIETRDRITDITYANGDKNTYRLVETDRSGNVLIQKTVEDGETVDGVAYDSNGNTVGAYNTETQNVQYLKVQVGEQTLTALAAKFGVDVNELYEANKDNPDLVGTGRNAKFKCVGCSFVLPGKFDSSDQRLQGRQTIEQIRSEANDFNEAQRERATRIMQEQNDRLMSKYRKYGLINTTGVGDKINVSQMTTTWDGTKTYNPPLQVTIFGEAFDGGRIGQVKGSNKIVYIDKNGIIRDDSSTRNAVQTFARNPERAQTITINGRQINVVYTGSSYDGKEVYRDSTGKMYYLTGGNFVDENTYNTREAAARNTRNANIGIADDLHSAITRNRGNDLGSDQFRTAFNKINVNNVLEVLDLYRERRGESLPEAIMDEVTSTGNANKCKQLVNLMKQRAQRAGMPADQLNSLYDKCINECNHANCSHTANLVTAINTFSGAITSFEMGGGRATNVSLGQATTEAANGARAGVNYQIDHQGWVGTAFEFTVGSIIGDSRVGVRRDIQAFEGKIRNLENIKKTQGQAAFERAFQAEFGVPFSQQALNNYVGLKNRYETAVQSKAAENEFSTFKNTINNNNVDSQIQAFIAKFGGNQKDQMRTTINNAIQTYMNQGMSKKDAFKRFLDQCITGARDEYNTAVGGRSISELGNAVKGAFDGMFGKNTGINETVAQYVDRQQAGEQYTLLAGKVALAVGAACTGNVYLTAGIVAVGGNAIDVSNDLTAAGDGYFGTRLTGERLGNHIVNNLENGALVVLGGAAEAYVTDIGLTGAQKVATLTVLDAASGTSMELICKGDQVTIEGIAYKVIFSTIGNVAQARLEKIGPVGTKDTIMNTGDMIEGITDVAS